MAQPLIGFLAFAIGIIAVAVAPVLAVWLIIQILKGLGFVVGGLARLVGNLLGRTLRFAGGVIKDSLHMVGSVITALAVAPLALGNLALLRFRAAAHYGAAVEDEIMGAVGSVYRLALGHPIQFLGLGALTDGLERRLPNLMEEAPRTAPARTSRWRRRRAMGRGEALRRGETPTFDGYVVEGELSPGGSGARLFSASPTAARVEALAARGVDVPDRVVIKAFDLGYGSTIPQIVRESRSLEAARSIGLIVEHTLEDDAFHYVMPFVPGEDLDKVTRRLHGESRRADGLDDDGVRAAVQLARDLCMQLGRFHSAGLWHKDIKPSNLMVSGGRLQVVDFGLVTPLESALTLTTHGTEFFRDPELVRLALAGKRVKDVDGVKFDIYSAGAVLYSVVENSFPAHGSLSSISRRAPEALRWIIRRAMADIAGRYASAAELGADLDVLARSADPFAVRPADLPSVSGVPAGVAAEEAVDEEEDIHRFEAFGVRAEVHGAGRIKRSFRERREARQRARQVKLDARAREREARAAARDEQKLRRRQRRRHVLRAAAALAMVVAIGGGALTALVPVSATPSIARASAMPAADSGAYWGFELQGDRPLDAELIERFARWERPLEVFPRGATVMVAADPSDAAAMRAAGWFARAMEARGVETAGVDARRPGMVADDAMVSQALRAASLAAGDRSQRRTRLEAMAAERCDLDGAAWVERHGSSYWVQLVGVQDSCPEPDSCSPSAWTGACEGLQQ